MSVAKIKKTLEELNKEQKKKFNQSIDLILTFKNLDLKKPANHVDIYVELEKSRNKKVKICAFVGGELQEEAKKYCDKVITDSEFPKYKEKKLAKKLAREFDYFIGQANIMTKIAATFGRTLGPRGKMPNPKAGAVIPPKGASIENIYNKLQKLVRVTVKTQLHYSISIGKEDSNPDDIARNIMTLYKAVIRALPQEKNNLKGVFIKKTMSKPIKVEM